MAVLVIPENFFALLNLNFVVNSFCRFRDFYEFKLLLLV